MESLNTPARHTNSAPTASRPIPMRALRNDWCTCRNPCATVSGRDSSQACATSDSASSKPLRNKHAQEESDSCSSQIQDQLSLWPLTLFVGQFGDVISKLAMITLRYQIIQES